MLKTILVAAAAMALVGCASVPMGDAKQDAAAKSFQVAPDQAGVYIYRNETMGAAVKMDVMVNGSPIGQTAAKTYLYKQVQPGKLTVASKAENTDTLEIDAKPGTLTYVWQEVKMGFGSARSKLHVVSEEEGKKGVVETKLAVTQ